MPELYDLEHAGFSDDVDLYLRLAEVVGDPDPGAGVRYGSCAWRRWQPLAIASPGSIARRPMLDRARSRCTASACQHRLAARDARRGLHDRGRARARWTVRAGHLLAERADAPVDTWPSNERRWRRRDELSIHEACSSIDLLNPTPELLTTFDGRVQHEGSWRNSDGTVVDRFSARTHDSAEQTIDTELWYDLTDPAGHIRRVRSGFPMRYLVASELALLLEVTGFVEWKLYGSYDLDPYDDGSERLIVTAEVTPS